MQRPMWARWSVSSSLRESLVLLGTAVGAILAMELLSCTWSDPVLSTQHILVALAAALYAGAGLVVWWQRPTSGMGAILVWGGGLWICALLESTSLWPGRLIGIVMESAGFAGLFHVLHAFPSGRLRRGLSRSTVVAAYFIAIPMQLPRFLFDGTSSLAIADLPRVSDAARIVQSSAAVIVIAGTLIVLWQRIRGVGLVRRRALLPLYLYGMFVALLAPIGVRILGSVFGLSVDTVNSILVALMAVAPLFVMLSVLHGGFARTGELRELGVMLGAVAATSADLSRAVRSTLGDELAQVLYYEPEGNGYVDATGDHVAVPPADENLAVADIRHEGRRVGVIIYDRRLIADPRVVRAAGRVVSVAVDNERLTAVLRGRERDLRASRARIVDAGDAERRVLAEHLQERMQWHLASLRDQTVRLANASATHAPIQRSAWLLHEHLRVAEADLTRIVHDVMPATLSTSGLVDAVHQLAARIPTPTTVFMIGEESALSPAEQRAGYFVIAESLTNAVKYAAASALRVRIASNGERITIQISDNGVGGASATAGFGLRGLADRVDALGGNLRVVSPIDAGTEVTADIPLARIADDDGGGAVSGLVSGVR